MGVRQKRALLLAYALTLGCTHSQQLPVGAYYRALPREAEVRALRQKPVADRPGRVSDEQLDSILKAIQDQANGAAPADLVVNSDSSATLFREPCSLEGTGAGRWQLKVKGNERLVRLALGEPPTAVDPIPVRQSGTLLLIGSQQVAFEEVPSRTAGQSALER